ncbi:unnamed protein product [Cuscuta campestris]|uniref:Late embryogenesis abundant protein LEA-2 subgroup domain-containing protein n=1 Tax=Cuscuta campestris TaxID=132261 RepID=A0A484KMF4_9ASTE|nr:unnamed protein product [Cuscuta campestris]
MWKWVRPKKVHAISEKTTELWGKIKHSTFSTTSSGGKHNKEASTTTSHGGGVNKRRCGCGCCLIIFGGILLILLGIVGLLIWYARPSQPVVTLAGTRLEHIKLKVKVFPPSVKLEITMGVTLNVNNTSNVDITYQAVTVQLSYEGKELVDSTSTNGEIKPMESSPVDLTLDLSADKIASTVPSLIEAAVKNQPVTFDALISFNGDAGLPPLGFITFSHPHFEDHASKEGSSVDSQVGDEVDIKPKAINKDDRRFNVVDKNEGPLAEDVANVDKPDPTFQEFSTSAGVVIAEYEIPKSVDKVTDADGKQAHSLMLIDTIKLFELVDVVKTEHLVSPRATTYVLCPVSSFHHFAPRSKMVEDSKSGLLLWFSILSPVLKHEWEPPP